MRTMLNSHRPEGASGGGIDDFSGRGGPRGNVCAQETKNFNDSAKTLPNVQVLVISMDLPFGQKRWCGAEGIDTVSTLSAHRCTKFGEDYGVLISGGPLDRCLARAVFVVDPAGKIKHVEYVKEIAEHPNYDAVLAAAK